MQNEQNSISTATFTNPFTGKEKTVVINGYKELLEAAEFECSKLFIREKLSEALKNEDIALDEMTKNKLQYLIVQLYQPTSLILLYEKLEKFREYLIETVPQFQEVYNYYNSVRGNHFNGASPIAVAIKCKDCESVYAVSKCETVADHQYFACPYCKSKNWEEAPAEQHILRTSDENRGRNR